MLQGTLKNIYLIEMNDQCHFLTIQKLTHSSPNFTFAQCLTCRAMSIEMIVSTVRWNKYNEHINSLCGQNVLHIQIHSVSH